MADSAITAGSAAEPAVRRIGTDELRAALAEGWADFLATPTQLVFLCIIYPVLGFVLSRAAYGGNLLALIYPLIAGFALVGPVAAIGMYELSRRREQGLSPSWVDAFQALRTPAIGSIALLGVVLLVIFAVWILVAQAIFTATLGEPPASLGELMQGLRNHPAAVKLILLGNFAGFLFAALVLVISVVSFPMLMDRDVGAAVAVKTSIRAVLANPVPMALWGLIVAALLVLGSLPIFVGLAVAMPVLGHATWHLYEKVVVR